MLRRDEAVAVDPKKKGGRQLPSPRRSQYAKTNVSWLAPCRAAVNGLGKHDVPLCPFLARLSLLHARASCWLAQMGLRISIAVASGAGTSIELEVVRVSLSYENTLSLHFSVVGSGEFFTYKGHPE